MWLVAIELSLKYIVSFIPTSITSIIIKGSKVTTHNSCVCSEEKLEIIPAKIFNTVKHNVNDCLGFGEGGQYIYDVWNGGSINVAG